MHHPIDQSTAMLPVHPPADPQPGQVFRVNKGQVVGGSTVINLFHKQSLIGSVTRIIPIPNVTRMYRAERVMCNKPLQRNALVRIQALQFSFVELTFIQNFGWVGTGTDKKTMTILDKFYKVLAGVPIGPQTNTFCLYEQLCLRSIEPKTKET